MLPFSKRSSMKTVLCGIVIVFLLISIQDDNMKTEAALTEAYKAAIRYRWDISKRLQLLKCCVRFCKGERCEPNPKRIKGCKCLVRDNRYKSSGRFVTYP